MTSFLQNRNKKLLAAFLSLILFAGTLLSNLSPTVEAAANEIDGLHYYTDSILNSDTNNVNTYVLEVDPSKLKIAAGVPDDAVPLQAGKRQTTKDQMIAARSHGKNVLAAVNADYFYINDDSKIQPQGITVMDGQQLTPYYAGATFFGMLDDGTPVIGDETVYEQVKAHLVQAVGADNGYLIKDGMIDTSIEDSEHEGDMLHPRTAVGIKADGSVVFVVADGRSTVSAGMTLDDLAHYFLTLGVVTAVNLDGGGSTTLDMRNPDTGEVVTKNVPSGGPERPVGNTLLIIDPNSSSNAVDLPTDTDGYYLIKSAWDFAQINRDPNASYRLANDIDLSGVSLGTIPLFNGKFDGNGKTLTNFTSNAALFDTLSTGASISDLRLTDVEIKGSANAAALVGKNSGTIAGITVTGTVSGTTNVGGIAGTLTGGGSITKSSVGAILVGTSGVGGIAGIVATSNAGTIESSYANVAIQAAGRAGGIIGYAPTGAASHVYNSIAEGKIDDSGIEAGGIGGLLQIGVENSIVRNMAITTTDTKTAVTSGNVSGLLGAWVNGAQKYQNNVIQSGSISMTAPGAAHRIGYHTNNKVNNYVNPDVTVNGSKVTAGLGPNTIEGENAAVEQLTSQSFYEGLHFDFNTVFAWDEVNKTPVLRDVDMTVDYTQYLGENTLRLFTGEAGHISVEAGLVSMASSNDAVASIDASGNVIAKGAGKAVLSLVYPGNLRKLYRIIVLDPELTAYPITVAKPENGKMLVSANVVNNVALAYTPNVVFSVYDAAGQPLDRRTVNNVPLAPNGNKLYQVDFDDVAGASLITMNVYPNDAGTTPLTQEMTYPLDIWKAFVAAIPNSTAHNAMLTFNDSDTIITFRTYAKPVSDFGQQTWRFGYSNSMDGNSGGVGAPIELGSPFSILSANIGDGGTVPDGSVLGEIVPLTFDGQTSKSVAPGEQFWSDEIGFNLPQDHYLSFTWVLRVKYDGGSIPYSLSSNSRMPSYMYNGNHGAQTDSEGFRNQSAVSLAPDVFAVKKTVDKRIAFLGDSITHGSTASLGKDAFWVANIAKRFAQDGIAVENDGVGGALAYEAAQDGYWLSKVKDSDEVTVMLGTNDINADRTKDELSADLKKIIGSIRTANPNAVVTLFTVPPFHYDTTSRQKTWLDVDALIRDRGAAAVEEGGFGADYVFDTGAVWSDGTSPWVMKTAYKAGSTDYHPNDAGSAALSDAYLAWFPTRDNPDQDEIMLEKDTDGYYLIHTAAELNQVNNHSTFNYRLASDIDLDGISMRSISSFSGDFDGNGHTIANMNIGSPLFSVLSEEGNIHDLRMDKATVITGNNAAVLAGTSYGTVEGVAVDGAVVKGGSYTGGIVGKLTGGTIKNSSVGAELTGSSGVGGIAGGTYTDAGTIEGCYANVDIEANGRAGGIIGYAALNIDARVLNNIVEGSIVETGIEAGGIGGLLQIGAQNNIVRKMIIATNNTATEPINGNVAGFLGAWVNGGQPYKNNVVLDGAITITSPGIAHRIGYHNANKIDNYVNADVTINGSKVTADIGGNTVEGADATMAELQTQDFYSQLGFDFANVFDWDSESRTPVLRGVDMTVKMPDPKIALGQLIELAQSKSEDGYRADSWAPFATALANAIAVRDDASATKLQLVAAETALKTAMEQLVPVASQISRVVLAIGNDETSRRVTWYSTSANPGKVQVAVKSAMTDGVFPTVRQEFASTVQSTHVTVNTSNKAIVTGLSANTEYVYRVGSDEGWSDIYSFKTRDFDNSAFSFLFAGDPQIGSSGNLGNDEKGWTNTLDKATQWFPDISFLASAGDQVELYNDESQYSSFLKPDVLRSLTLATNIGNHDTNGVNYKEHFSVPNEQANLGDTPAGGDYWYSYNGVLFMSLNSNNLSTAQHQAFLISAIAAYKEQHGGKEPIWKIVTLHHSIYSTAIHAVAADILQRRNELSPIFNDLGVDAVLMGHDHVYTRSYMMNGTTPITTGYTAANGDNFAIYNKTKDAKETFYLTANSASGSKFYSIQNLAFPFAAMTNQENTTNITKIDVKGNSLTFTTYRTGEANTVNDVLDTFTLNRETGVTDVTVTPSTAAVQAGSTQSFSATVNGDNNPEQTVTWSVEGTGNTGTTISGAGVLTVAADETASTLTVKATSTSDTTKFGTATVTVDGISDGTVTFSSNGAGYDAKTVHKGDAIGSASWPTDPARTDYSFGGWFTGENGTGTPFTSETPVTDTMTVYAYWTPSGDTGVTGVTVTPSTATVRTGSALAFSVTVNGENNPEQTVTWSVYGTDNTATTISDVGVLTVAADEAASALTVKATSTADTTKFGTAAVTVETDGAVDTDAIVTFSSNGAGYDTKTVHKGDAIGSAAWPADPARTGYSFGGWFTGENGMGAPFTSETPVTGTMTAYAYWTSGGNTGVTGVTVTPSTAAVHKGSTQAFSAAVIGENHPAQTVTWSVYGTGNTSTTISSAGVLTVAADETAITLTVKAASTADASKFGTATVTVAAGGIVDNDATVTFSSIGAAYAAKTVHKGDAIGSAAWPVDPARANYSFGGWFTGDNGTGARFTSETPVTSSLTVFAYWTYSGGGSSGGSGGNAGGSSGNEDPADQPNNNLDVTTANGVKLKLPFKVDEANGTIFVDASSYHFKSGSLAISLPADTGADTYAIGIPVSELSSPDGQGTLSVKGENVSIAIPDNMLTGVAGVSGSKAVVSIGYGDKSALKEDVKAAIGNRPFIQLTLSIDGRQVDWSNADAPVKVSIPYVPTAAELADPESIVVWYIDGNGDVHIIPNGRYDSDTGTVTFSTTHFSDYAVAYGKVIFNDVAAGSWYNEAVSFLAAREITTGMGNGNFGPETKLTRGQFIVLLMRAFGIDSDANPASNFSDAGDTYYTGYLAAAKRLGLSLGVGNNLFAPDKEIARQEMFTLLYNVLDLIGKLPQGDSGKTLSDFSDSAMIDSWSKEALTLLVKTGIVSGSGGALNPNGTATRAEMAQVLYMLLRQLG